MQITVELVTVPPFLKCSHWYLCDAVGGWGNELPKKE